MDASNILVSLFYSVEEPLGLAPAMRRKQQLEKLQRLNHAAREFARAWRGMHFDVQEEVKRRGTAALDGRDFGFDTEGEWKRFWRTLPHLDRMVGTAVPPARALINAAPEAGKSDMRIIDIIGPFALPGRLGRESRHRRTSPKAVPSISLSMRPSRLWN